MLIFASSWKIVLLQCAIFFDEYHKRAWRGEKMKISRDLEIFIYRGIVIIVFDLIFVSFIFLCGAFAFF